MSSRLLRSRRHGEALTVHADGTLVAGPAPAPAAAQQTNAAADIVEEARHRADEVLRLSAHSAAESQSDAYREGRDQGYHDGAAAARAELAEALALVQQIALDARALRDRLLANAEREIVELVLAVARTVLGEHVQLDPSVAAESVRRALKRAGAQNVVRVRVNPQDRELVSAGLAEEAAAPGEGWQVVADGAVAVGGCIVDTARGEVDARLDVQLDEVARAFLEAAGGGQAQADEAVRDAA